ncbi:endo-1,4-beta-xylanase [Mucilaginibacter mali]|uniref:Beta-xylanase n=1 Tax=Mucilaginibacter mali TaxID=2740462 RepID=A0A7D4UL48_9SPHI|nr:endo-1,4-beta-xylanase [Mucilaginibacter mali]QKJ31482.1 endo-1,4-beta-xylanase [Mucilaginibacter mali]
MAKKNLSGILLIAILAFSSFIYFIKGQQQNDHNISAIGIKADSSVKYSRQSVFVADTAIVKTSLLKKGTYFGCYLSEDDVNLAPPRPKNYLQELNRYFNLYSLPAWYMHIENKGRGIYNFTSTDQVADFAVKHGAKMQAHNMVWNSYIPEWITKGNYSPNDLADILKKHIQAVMRHYRDKYPGTIIGWDIVNEAMSDEEYLDPAKTYPNGLRKDKPIWNVIHKPGSTDPTDFIQLAFEWAHEADPSAKLYWNEYSAEYKGFKMDRWFKIIKQLRDKGVPIHGVGFQTHLSLSYAHPIALRENMERFAAIGVESQITEMDVLMSSVQISDAPFHPEYLHSSTANLPTIADFEKQADIYRQVINACIMAKNCKALILFGAWDPVTWANRTYKDKRGNMTGPFYPNILDDKMHQKLAFKALADEVKSKIK